MSYEPDLAWYAHRMSANGWRVVYASSDAIQFEKPDTLPAWVGVLLALFLVGGCIAWLLFAPLATIAFGLAGVGIALILIDRLTRRPELRFVTGLDARTARQQEPT